MIEGKEDDTGFRVIDKRGRSEEETAQEKAGEGFVMHEKPDEAGQSGPNEIDFATLVYSFATSAMIALGKVKDPQSGKPTEVNLPLAKQNIDILAMLQAKTRGNLTQEEAQMVEHFVTELRLMFVEVSNKAK